MLSLSVQSFAYTSAFARTSTIKAVAEGVAPEISDAAGLKDLAIKLNPVIGYWDPLGVGETSPENIGWVRQAEIKLGGGWPLGPVGRAPIVGQGADPRRGWLPGDVRR